MTESGVPDEGHAGSDRQGTPGTEPNTAGRNVAGEMIAGGFARRRSRVKILREWTRSDQRTAEGRGPRGRPGQRLDRRKLLKVVFA